MNAFPWQDQPTILSNENCLYTTVQESLPCMCARVRCYCNGGSSRAITRKLCKFFFPFFLNWWRPRAEHWGRQSSCTENPQKIMSCHKNSFNGRGELDSSFVSILVTEQQLTGSFVSKISSYAKTVSWAKHTKPTTTKRGEGKITRQDYQTVKPGS